MQPPPRQAGGPPIWCGGRSDAALRRIGRMTDGWMSYVVTPEMFQPGPGEDRARRRGAAACFDRSFGTAHLLFTRIDDTYEKALDAATASLSTALRHGLPQGRPSATARSARRSRVVEIASARSTRPAPATSLSISSAPTRSATGRSNASPPRRCRCWRTARNDRL